MSNTDNDNGPASDQFDLTLGMEWALNVGDIYGLAEDLKDAEAFDADDADDETLAEYSAALKELSDAVEESRKTVFEATLDERTDLGDEIGPVVKQRGSNRYVTDHAAAFDAVLDAGEDPRDVAKVSAPKLAELLGDDADEFVDETEYTYFRRRQ